jgi:hypothetical protein
MVVPARRANQQHRLGSGFEAMDGRGFCPIRRIFPESSVVEAVVSSSHGLLNPPAEPMPEARTEQREARRIVTCEGIPSIRLVPHYAFGVFFIQAHLGSGLRGVVIAHGMTATVANRLWAAGIVVSALVSVAIVSGLCGVRI